MQYFRMYVCTWVCAYLLQFVPMRAFIYDNNYLRTELLS